MGRGTVVTDLKVQLGAWTNRTVVLPLLAYFPTSRCNSRCVSCDWWTHSGSDDLSLDEVDRLVDDLPALGTRVVLFSGGEPLARPEVFEIARRFRARGLTLHLHTSGLALERHAADVAQAFARVMVSLDAATETAYAQIRGVAGLAALERGVARLRRLAPDLPVTARCTLHRHNFRQMARIIEHARAMALDGISFLAADASSGAFGRSPADAPPSLGLDARDVGAFADVVEEVILERADDFACGFVHESPEKLRRLPSYYAAQAGIGPYPVVECSAPRVSVVIEANGDVRPCFFHDAIGSLRERPLREIVGAPLAAFRERWSTSSDVRCTRCVCALRTSWKSAPWH